jgi:hypothetical protein
VSKPRAARLESDLQHYFRNKTTVFSPQIHEVIADVIRFTSASFKDGLRVALAALSPDGRVDADRPFIQVCEAIVETHVRSIGGPERELFGKSLSEAYIHFAGPQYVFETPGRTRFMHSLRRRGAKDFAGVFLSLHLFNVICADICDEVSGKMPDQQTYELYMFEMEAMCRDVVARAMDIPDGELDEQWAAAIINGIEAQLFRVS